MKVVSEFLAFKADLFRICAAKRLCCTKRFELGMAPAPGALMPQPGALTGHTKAVYYEISTRGHDDNTILRICLNPYSPRYQKLKASEFLLPFGQAVLDPIVEEEAGRAYIPDPEIERREQEFTRALSLCDPVLHHLAEKYKTAQLLRLDFNTPEFAIRSR